MDTIRVEKRFPSDQFIRRQKLQLNLRLLSGDRTESQLISLPIADDCQSKDTFQIPSDAIRKSSSFSRENA